MKTVGPSVKILVLVLGSAWAGVASAEPASLAAFDRLVGHCWQAHIEEKTTDTHCFSAVYGGKHVRDRHAVVVSDRVVYRGESVYSLDAGTVVFTYFNSLGGVGQGKAQTVPGGVDFTGSMRATPTSKPESLESRWRWSETGYTVVNVSSKPITFAEVSRAPDPEP